MVRVRKRWRRLRENHVRIGATESERIYACEPFAVCFRERLDLSWHSQFQFFEIDVRIRRSEMQASRNFTMLKNQHRFQKARDPGSRLEMSQIAFHRPDR